MSTRPAHTRDDRAQTNHVLCVGSECRHEAPVALDEPADPTLTNIVARAAAFGEGTFAHDSCVGRMEAFDILLRELPVLAGHSAHAPPRVGERAVRFALLVQPTHHAVEPLPEIVHQPQPTI